VTQLLAKRLLERWGYDVVLAETGAQAVAAHAQQKFDIILMDVQMPGMNGFVATERSGRLRARPMTARRSSR